MKYRNVNFEIDILGVDIWRWTILPRRASDLTLIGQARGTRDEAITYCTVEIDGLLAREDAALKPHRDDDRR
jgi:hypothetical protein